MPRGKGAPAGATRVRAFWERVKIIAKIIVARRIKRKLRKNFFIERTTMT